MAERWIEPASPVDQLPGDTALRAGQCRGRALRGAAARRVTGRRRGLRRSRRRQDRRHHRLHVAGHPPQGVSLPADVRWGHVSGSRPSPASGSASRCSSSTLPTSSVVPGRGQDRGSGGLGGRRCAGSAILTAMSSRHRTHGRRWAPAAHEGQGVGRSRRLHRRPGRPALRVDRTAPVLPQRVHDPEDGRKPPNRLRSGVVPEFRSVGCDSFELLVAHGSRPPPDD